MKTLLNILTIAAVCFTAVHAHGEQEMSKEQIMLKRMYQMRIAFENERIRSENEARANVRLMQQGNPRHLDSPTVSGMRQQTNIQLSRFEQRFRCLDVDVDQDGGNTVVICGDNSGDINGSNTSAGRDLTIVDGGTP